MTVTSPAAATANAGAAASGAPPEEASVTPSSARRKSSKKTGTSATRASASASAKASAKASDAIAEAVRRLAPGVGLPGLVRAVVAQAAAALRSSSAAGYATAQTAALKSSDLAFLKDPRLSLEEKLMKLLGVLNAKWDKEMQDKLDKIAAGEKPATSSTSSTKAKSKGILGGIVSAFTGALGAAGGALDVLKIPAVKTALKKLGGPVLAAAASALGFPAAAPVLLKYGPDVVNAALGIASAAGGSASKTSPSTSGSGAAMSDSERQTIMTEIQFIRDKQKEMFGLVSNILKSGHDTRMSIIGNIR